MSATSKDVGRLAGVSQPTVSRALRGQAGVAPETRRRVEEAAQALGYVTSQLGRALVTRRTGRIGIVLAELTNPFYPHLVGPLHDHFLAAGFRSVLFAEREEDTVQIPDLADDSLDGVVLTTTVLGSQLPEALARRGMPFVFLNREGDGVADSSVMDNEHGASLLADLLVGLGHEDFGAVLGPRATTTGRDRERGFRRALAAQGLTLPDESTYSGPFSYEVGRDGLRAVVAQAHPPTAVFCANDVLALGALDEATRLGIRVPEDLSIVGFDDIGLAAWERFSLTTVHTDLSRLAVVAADLLLQRIADPSRDHLRVVQRPELVLRGSHAGPRSKRTLSRTVSAQARSPRAAG